MPEREFDVVIFGATGYTGRYVIEELAKVCKGTKKWAVAGRNIEKLIASLESVRQYLQEDNDIMNTPIIEADVNDETSISNMCKRARLILNCVGPYKFYGEVVVSACVENGTHHVDLSAEVQYLETTQARYFNKAQEKGAYIVQACGFDAIPADYGTALLKKKFSGELNSVRSYCEIYIGPEGRVTNVGTWMSAVNSISDILTAGKYRYELDAIFTKKLPQSKYPMTWRWPVFFSEDINGWCLLSLGPDESIIKRSQMFGYQFLNERPVQSKEYFHLNSVFTAVGLALLVPVFGFLAFFSIGRYLLGKYPSLFSLGNFSKEGPTRKQVKEGRTKFILYGEGWVEKTSEPSDQHSTPPNKKMKLIISGPEAAYDFTSICMVHSGLTILDESSKMPLRGGVLTPGVAFADTTLKERLEKRGITFEFLE